MNTETWIIFALFWLVVVLTPGPNAVICLTNGMTFGLSRALVGVLAILTQATIFLLLCAFGAVALLAAAPWVLLATKLGGAAILIYLRWRAWTTARTPVRAEERPASHIHVHALTVALLNPKNLVGYFAAFSQVITSDVPLATQLQVILPTALALTALVYTGYCALGAGLGRAALGHVFNLAVRRVQAACFIIYGLALGTNATAQFRG